MFHTFLNKIYIEGTVNAIKPVAVGSGKDEFDPTEVKSPVLKDYKGNPVIPGSSLKGVLRSNIEMILRNDKSYKVCDIFEKECVNENDYKKMKDSYKTDIRSFSEELYGKYCDVCKLFGGKHLASKIQFKDMMFIGDKPFFEIRDGVGIDRDKGIYSPGAKYNFEVVSAGTKFDFYMVLENIELKQFKVIDLIIFLLTSGDLCVGGKTSRGMGQIKLEDYKIFKLDKNSGFQKINITELAKNSMYDYFSSLKEEVS